MPAGFDAPDLAAPLITPRTRSIFIESPANPNNRLTDIGRMKALALRHAPAPAGQGSGRILVLVDNTMAGPVFAQPARVGADIVLYSATKLLGGITDDLVRLSIGIEHPADLVWDLQQALEHV